MGRWEYVTCPPPLPPSWGRERDRWPVRESPQAAPMADPSTQVGRVVAGLITWSLANCLKFIVDGLDLYHQQLA